MRTTSRQLLQGHLQWRRCRVALASIPLLALSKQYACEHDKSNAHDCPNAMGPDPGVGSSLLWVRTLTRRYSHCFLTGDEDWYESGADLSAAAARYALASRGTSLPDVLPDVFWRFKLSRFLLRFVSRRKCIAGKPQRYGQAVEITYRAREPGNIVIDFVKKP